jgi:hypothetical protein
MGLPCCFAQNNVPVTNGLFMVAGGCRSRREQLGVIPRDDFLCFRSVMMCPLDQLP